MVSFLDGRPVQVVQVVALPIAIVNKGFSVPRYGVLCHNLATGSPEGKHAHDLGAK